MQGRPEKISRAKVPLKQDIKYYKTFPLPPQSYFPAAGANIAISDYQPSLQSSLGVR